MSHPVVSPITNQPAVKIESFDRDFICDAYSNDFNIDVRPYFEKIEHVDLMMCEKTGYRFFHPKSLCGNDLFYQQLNAHAGYFPEEKWEFETALSYVHKNDEILDVGCGEGNFIKFCQHNGYSKIMGIDSSFGLESFQAEKHGQIIRTNIESFSKDHKGSFNIITCFQVLEHVYDVKHFIDHLVLCLKPGGEIIIAVPNNNPFLYKHDKFHTLNLPPHHIGWWNKSSLIALGNFSNLDIVNVETESIENHIGKYTQIQTEYLKKKSKLLSYALGFSSLRKIYEKYLYMKRHKLPGRNILIVYRKKR